MNILNLENFEFYLEGILIKEVSSMSITETMGQPGLCSLQLPATNPSLNLLAKTILQIFGPDPLEPPNSELILVFEGELSSLQYSKSASGTKTLTLSFVSLTSEALAATVKPVDSLVPSAYVDAVLGNDQKVYTKIATEAQKDEMDKAKTHIVNTFGAGSLTTLIDGINSNPTAYTTRGDFSSIFKPDENSPSSGLYAACFRSSKFVQNLEDSFDLSSSIYISKDKEFANFVKSSILTAAFQQWSAGGSNKNLYQFRVIPLSSFLQTLFTYTKHVTAFPATPTHVPNPGNLVRMTAIRYATALMPPMCNVFLPDDYAGLVYVDHLVSKPTRVVASMYIEGMDAGILANNGFSPFEALNLKEEEDFRGVLAIEPSIGHKYFSGIQADAPDQTIKAFNQELGSTNGLRPKFRTEAINAWAEARGGASQVILTTTWNPHRHVGLPALIIGKEDEPSFSALISSISTTIQAGGQVNSSLQLSDINIIDTTANNLFLDGTQAGKSAELNSEEKELLKSVVSVKNRQVMDEISTIASKAYTFRYTGITLYEELIQGVEIPDYDSVINDTTKKDRSSIYALYPGTIDPEVTDSSIIYTEVSKLLTERPKKLSAQFRKRNLVKKSKYLIQHDITQVPFSGNLVHEKQLYNKHRYAHVYFCLKKFMRKVTNSTRVKENL